MSSPVDQHLVAQTLGVIQIGVLLNSVLLGVSSPEWVTYFGSKFKDVAIVYWTILLDIIHTAISWEVRPEALDARVPHHVSLLIVPLDVQRSKLWKPRHPMASHWEYDSGPILIIFCAAPIQASCISIVRLFLAWRIRQMLSRAPYRLDDLLFGMTVTLCLIQMIFGLYMSINLLIGITTTAGYVKFVKIAVAWESFAIATDMTIMISCIGTLMYKRTGFRHTDWMILNLIMVSVECAIPVTLFTVAHMAGVNLNTRAKFRQTPDVSYASGVNDLGILGGMADGRPRPQVRIDVTREEQYVMQPTSTSESKRSNTDFKVAHRITAALQRSRGEFDLVFCVEGPEQYGMTPTVSG
ncbi:hypothetical protein B0H10DRAFT_1975007 [Mycena sp. CBHHK59/15]|nr:hypothetical protein B0H10DRAFT_1975007 [Mycena sp. CBHHK59/15]